MRYDLVFAGGGAKGIVHAGALKELEAQGHTFGRLVGTSAGAITALLLAAGYDADNILDAITERQADGRLIFASLMDVPDSFQKEAIQDSLINSALENIIPSFIPSGKTERLKEKIIDVLLESLNYRQLFSFVEFGGFYAGQQFLDWLRQKLNATGRQLADLTLAQFHQQTGNHFTAVATNTNSRIMLILNHISAPDLPVIWAVRMSMSIPLVFQEVIWQSEWGLYYGRDISGHTIVDGGLTSNFPIGLFLSEDPTIVKIMGGASDPAEVIGLLIDIDLPVPGADLVPPKKKPVSRRINVDSHLAIVEKRITNLVEVMRTGHDNLEALLYPQSVCRLPAKDYDTLEADMSDKRVALLVAAGRQAMRQYLDKTQK